MRLPKIGSSDINVKKSRFPTRIIPFKCLKFPYKCKLTPTVFRHLYRNHITPVLVLFFTLENEL